MSDRPSVRGHILDLSRGFDNTLKIINNSTSFSRSTGRGQDHEGQRRALRCYANDNLWLWERRPVIAYSVMRLFERVHPSLAGLLFAFLRCALPSLPSLKTMTEKCYTRGARMVQWIVKYVERDKFYLMNTCVWGKFIMWRNELATVPVGVIKNGESNYLPRKISFFFFINVSNTE